MNLLNTIRTLALAAVLLTIPLTVDTGPVEGPHRLSVRPAVACGQVVECEYNPIKVCVTPIRDVMYYRYVRP